MPLKLKEINVSIPTGGRQTSWLFTSMTEELNFDLPRNNSLVELYNLITDHDPFLQMVKRELSVSPRTTL